MGLVDLPRIFLPLGAFAVNVLALMVVLHISVRTEFVRAVVFAFGSGLAALLALELIGNPGLGEETLSAWVILVGDLTIYASLSYVFFNVVNIGESAIRVRILREIAKAGGTIGEPEFRSAYNEDIILKIRLDRWLKKGRIVRKSGRWVLQSNGLLAIERVFWLMKIILVRRTSEFE